MSSPNVVQANKLRGDQTKLVENFVTLYNLRSDFFSDAFVKKVKSGDRKALAELKKHAMPPTRMDLRAEFAKCVQANVPEETVFTLKDGKQYTMQQLKVLVPEWAVAAETALINSDPEMADKLMTLMQWNAKSAFEVTYTTAVNDLHDLKKVNDRSKGATLEHYTKWTLNPLKRAIEEVKSLKVPLNALIGYGSKRYPISETLPKAEKIEAEFQKFFAERK
jgi:hypothetical protein